MVFRRLWCFDPSAYVQILLWFFGQCVSSVYPLFSLFIHTLIVTLDCLDLHLYNWHIYLVSKDIYIYNPLPVLYIYILYSPIIINNPQCLLVNIPAFPKISSLRCTPRCSRSPHQESGAPRCCDRSYGLETSQETHGFSHEIWEFPTLENQFWET